MGRIRDYFKANDPTSSIYQPLQYRPILPQNSRAQESEIIFNGHKMRIIITQVDISVNSTSTYDTSWQGQTITRPGLQNPQEISLRGIVTGMTLTDDYGEELETVSMNPTKAKDYEVIDERLYELPD